MFLIGPRGAGKTSAGRLAAGMLDLPFVDTDAGIEERTGQTVTELFTREGEACFRVLERELLLGLLAGHEPVLRAPLRTPGRLRRSARGASIVATGGGCILAPDVRAALSRRAGVVWLFAPLPVLQLRIQGSGRPSLTGADPVDELALLVREREPLYRESCHGGVQLDTGELSPAQVATFIARRYHALVEGGA